MTKKLAQNVIAEYWSKITCLIVVKWPKNSFLLITFFLNKIEKRSRLIWQAVNPCSRIFSKLGMGVEQSKKTCLQKNMTFLAQAVPEIWPF